MRWWSLSLHLAPHKSHERGYSVYWILIELCQSLSVSNYVFPFEISEVKLSWSVGHWTKLKCLLSEDPSDLLWGDGNARYFQFLLLAPRELKSLTCWMFPWDGVKVWDGGLWGCVYEGSSEKRVWGGGDVFEDRKEICEIVLFISPHFCFCLSVCLSVCLIPLEATG
jgi:hypothetical protein